MCTLWRGDMKHLKVSIALWSSWKLGFHFNTYLLSFITLIKMFWVQQASLSILRWRVNSDFWVKFCLDWSNLFLYSCVPSSESPSFSLAGSSWRRIHVLCIWCNIHWHPGSVGWVKTKATHQSVSPEHTAPDAAYTPANTMWHLIYHQSLQVNAS